MLPGLCEAPLGWGQDENVRAEHLRSRPSLESIGRDARQPQNALEPPYAKHSTVNAHLRSFLGDSRATQVMPCIKNHLSGSSRQHDSERTEGLRRSSPDARGRRFRRIWDAEGTKAEPRGNDFAGGACKHYRI